MLMKTNIIKKVLNPHRTYWDIATDFLLDCDDSDVVLFAPKSYSGYQEMLDRPKVLGDVCMAEQDCPGDKGYFI